MKRLILISLICLVLAFSACSDKNENQEFNPSNDLLGDNDTSFGEDITEEVNKGFFEEEVSDVKIEYISGTKNAYKWEDNTLTFTSLSEDSVYSLSGKLNGNIIIDIGNEYKLDLELCGFSLVCDSINPITALSGNKVTLTAKKGYESFIYDKRGEITDEGLYSGAIYSMCDLEISGKGALTVSSDNNNGIHTKDDLEVKNLTLTVSCVDNALKGNDSVTIEGGKTTLIATRGDGIKTTNSNISEKGNQRGTVSITGGEHAVYAACDGIDSAYNVEINDEATVLNIYTDKYSNYSKEVTAVDENVYYIRFSSDALKYSVKYYNSDSDYEWVNAAHHSTVSGDRSSYYYYSFDKKDEYSKIQLFIYTSDMEQGQGEEYYACTDYLTLSTAYDTFALSTRGGSLGYSWTNYTTNVSDGMGGFGGGPGGMGGPGGFGGMNEGNTDKGNYSTKGIKASNKIVINQGAVNIKSYDDAIHANSDTELENGIAPLGNVTINGGAVVLYSNDDGLHADGTLEIMGGSVSVVNSYEGAEGAYVNIKGGSLSIIAKDDGINSTVTQGTAITVSGGKIYIYCNGDGIDANTRTSYGGIVFEGGDTVVISTSGGNSALDTEQGYSYVGGRVVAIMPSGGMSREATDCQSFSSIGKSDNVSLSADRYLEISVNGDTVVTVKMPSSINGYVIYLGSSSAKASSSSNANVTLDENGVCWN
ncbi:MAG: carbohydrate-binding domain-containing protein [Ruminococcaceae bacterium]|nr:carbohydrate-binding domain-containing protein [Oscillospiraceae bacterium]